MYENVMFEIWDPVLVLFRSVFYEIRFYRGFLNYSISLGVCVVDYDSSGQTSSTEN